MLDKLLSGRFWLAIMSGLALIIMVRWEDPPREALCAIVASVFTSYFSKKKDGQ